MLKATGKIVTHVLAAPLKINGKLYLTGAHVELDESDAEVYAMRGLSSPAPVVAETVKKDPEATTVPAATLGIVTKQENRNGGAAKRR